MSTQQAGRPNLVLATLFLGTFVLGMAELLVVGVLNLIAADLHISIPAAGTLLTANALGLAIGGPILTAVTIKLNRRTVLVGALAGFIAANLVQVLTADYALFVAARTVSGSLQGLFIAAAFVAGPGGQLASSLPASAINIGIAFGSLAGGAAIGHYTASAAVVTGLVIAVIAIPVAWATSLLKPPVVEQATEPIAVPAGA